MGALQVVVSKRDQLITQGTTRGDGITPEMPSACTVISGCPSELRRLWVYSNGGFFEIFGEGDGGGIPCYNGNTSLPGYYTALQRYAPNLKFLNFHTPKSINNVII